MDGDFWRPQQHEINVGARRLGHVVEVGRNFVWIEGTCARVYQLDAGNWPPGDPPEVGMPVSFTPHWRYGQLYAIDPIPSVRA